MPNFVKVASISDLKPGTAMTVVANGKEIALYNVAGRFAPQTTPASIRAALSAKESWRGK